MYLLGADKNNYSLTIPGDLTADITAKELTVTGAIAQDKEFDENTNCLVDFSSASLAGVITGETVTLNTTGYSASFDNANVGNNKDVTVTGLLIEGTDSGNYTLVLKKMLL